MNPAKGSSSKVQWNPSYSIPSDPTSTPTIMLGHELVHAYHNGTGTARNGPHDSYAGQTGTSNRGEERATVGCGGTSVVAPDGTTQRGAGSQRGRANRKFDTRRPRRPAPAHILSVELARRAAVVAVWLAAPAPGCSVALLAFLLAIRLSWGMNMYAQNGDIQLSAEVSLTADRLVLSYRIDNTGGSDIYLLNKVYKALPKAEIDKDFAYVFLTEQGGLDIEKDIPPVPAGCRRRSLVVPYMSVVRAGASFTETVEFALPVRQYIEYSRQHAAGRSAKGARRDGQRHRIFDRLFRAAARGDGALRAAARPGSRAVPEPARRAGPS